MASSLARLTVVLGCCCCCAIAGVNADDGWHFKGPAAVAADSDDWSPARETLTDSLDPLGWTPKPTAAPDSSNDDNSNSSEKKHKHDLEPGFGQDDDDEFPTVCATSGSSGGAPGSDHKAVTCDKGSFCTADIEAHRVGCCQEKDAEHCSIATTCVELTAARFLRQRADSKTLSCNDKEAPFCVTYSYVAGLSFGGGAYGGFQMFSCTHERKDKTVTVHQPASFDYGSATTNPPVLTTTAATPGRETTTDGTASFPTSVQGLGTATTADPNSGLPTTSSITSDGSSSGATSTSKNRTGTIVGGVVGGVGGAALIATAVLFFLYRRRRRDQAHPDGSSGTGPEPDLGATYYPGPQDPPLHPTQYGHGPLFSPPPMGQVSPYHGDNNNNNNLAAAAAIPATTTARSNTRRTVSSRTPSSFLAAATGRAVSPKSADDDTVSPISSRPSSSSGAPESPHWQQQQQQQQLGGLSPASPASPASSSMPPVQYSRFSPPPPEQFQAYRPYPGT